MEEKSLTDTGLIAALDAEDIKEPEEDHDETPVYREYMAVNDRKKIIDSLNNLLSSSFNLVLTTLILSTGLFFSVIVITLWADCPTIIWGAFMGFSVLAPLAIMVISVILLSRYGASSRYSLRER